MHVTQEARYRLRLAEGFLNEARQDLTMQRWRACVDNSQLAAENAAKAVLALVGPVGATHEPSELLRRALLEQRFPVHAQAHIQRIAACAGQLGWHVHIETDYGDERNWKTPWELFGEPEARRALDAEETVRLTKELITSIKS